jgi:hypothetical protein
MSRVCDALLAMHLLGSFAAQNMTVVDAAGAYTKVLREKQVARGREANRSGEWNSADR